MGRLTSFGCVEGSKEAEGLDKVWIGLYNSEA